jgi:hypothetical protein
MIRRILEAIVIGFGVAAVTGSIIGGVYCYSRANNGGHNGNEMDTFGQYAGLCFDAALLGGLATVPFALRRRLRWSASTLTVFVLGGLLILIVVGPIPSFQLGQTLENDAQDFLVMLSLGCILLAVVGAIMVIYAVAKALGNNKGDTNRQGD